MAVTRRKPQHYVNNKEFSQAVVEYVERVNEAEAAGDNIPVVPDYIATCFLKIAEGLSHKPFVDFVIILKLLVHQKRTRERRKINLVP